MDKSSRTLLRKITAVIVSVLMICIVLFSVFYIATEVHHECEGEHCHVCECIEICVSILQRFGFKTSSASASGFLMLLAAMTVLIPVSVYTGKTPVSLKVRLNN